MAVLSSTTSFFSCTPKHFLKLVLFILLAVCAISGAADAKRKKPKKLQFYMNIIIQNNTFLDNPHASYTSVLSGQAPVTPQPNAFGNLHTFDNPLSKTMTLNKSDLVGRVQGWYGNCGQSALTLCLAQTFTYDDGVYKGTFALLGSGLAMEPVKVEPIVGGTGDFAFCTGISSQSRVFDANIDFEEHAWFQYNVTFKF